MPIVKLECSDGVVVAIDVEIAKSSGTIKTKLEGMSEEEREAGEAIRLPKVKSHTLNKVFEWIIHHKDDVVIPLVPDIEPLRDDVMSPWDANFVNLDQVGLYDLLMAAYYLDVKKLLELTCQKVADLVKSKPVEEIKRMFNIPRPPTAEN